jgi:hypothetical protein
LRVTESEITAYLVDGRTLSVPLLEELGGVILRRKFTTPLTARGLKITAAEAVNRIAQSSRR